MSTFTNELSHRPDWSVASRMGLDDRAQNLKRTAAGVIDYDFYLRRAHRIRAEAARGFLRQAGSALRSAFGRAGNRWTPGYRLLSSH